MKHLAWVLLLLLPQDKGDIRLLVRADDMGVALGVNEACIKSVKDGIARSVEVLVPGPWFLDAVRRLQENPEIDVGVHLCLTSEWERVKWRPVTGPSSISDKDGYFFPTTRQRKDFPPNTALFESGPKPEDIEKELRAQIETLKRYIPRISHASSHMGAAVGTPEARAITEKLCKEYGLRLEAKGAKGVRNWSGSQKTAEEKEAGLVAAIEKLEPGTWIIVEHPGVDTEEMKALGHKGYENVGADRVGVTRAFTSDKVKEAVKARGVKLISHLELTESNPTNAHPIMIKHPDHLESAMGLLVTLVGVVSESKVPTLLGVEIESDSPDLRGKPATATGLLEKSVVTQEEIDRLTLQRGTFANRGPGTFYRLVDPNWGNTVQVQPMN